MLLSVAPVPEVSRLVVDVIDDVDVGNVAVGNVAVNVCVGVIGVIEGGCSTE